MIQVEIYIQIQIVYLLYLLSEWRSFGIVKVSAVCHRCPNSRVCLSGTVWQWGVLCNALRSGVTLRMVMSMRKHKCFFLRTLLSKTETHQLNKVQTKTPNMSKNSACCSINVSLGEFWVCVVAWETLHLVKTFLFLMIKKSTEFWQHLQHHLYRSNRFVYDDMEVTLTPAVSLCPYPVSQTWSAGTGTSRNLELHTLHRHQVFTVLMAVYSTVYRADEREKWMRDRTVFRCFFFFFFLYYPCINASGLTFAVVALLCDSPELMDKIKKKQIIHFLLMIPNM